jgi:LAS superfamily LD-carboxypeptidase LdcB
LASLAAPGSSKHNLGIAVDVHSATEPKRLQWLVNNVRRFGFSWEVVPEEPWHLRYTEGDDVPSEVKEYMKKNSINAPALPNKAEKSAEEKVGE